MDGLQYVDCEQGSPEWFQSRMGIPTASEFKTLIGIKKDARDKVTRKTYMKKLAGEIISGLPMESYSNEYMQRGKDWEADARRRYTLLTDNVTKQVGFARNGRKGASPDSLVAEDGLIEIKTKAPQFLIDILDEDEFPSEFKPQCQGALWVTEREWIDLVCYWPGFPLFVKRAYWEPEYIAMLRQAVDEFNEELDAMVDRVRRYGGIDTARAA